MGLNNPKSSNTEKVFRLCFRFKVIYILLLIYLKTLHDCFFKIDSLFLFCIFFNRGLVTPCQTSMTMFPWKCSPWQVCRLSCYNNTNK